MIVRLLKLDDGTALGRLYFVTSLTDERDIRAQIKCYDSGSMNYRRFEKVADYGEISVVRHPTDIPQADMEWVPFVTAEAEQAFRTWTDCYSTVLEWLGLCDHSPLEYTDVPPLPEQDSQTPPTDSEPAADDPGGGTLS